MLQDGRRTGTEADYKINAAAQGQARSNACAATTNDCARPHISKVIYAGLFCPQVLPLSMQASRTHHRPSPRWSPPHKWRCQ
eukprot:355995-Pleurochrysis_carterae.AAC.1